ncbi:ECF RNA polymerase sigma factor SigK [Streptomyces antarcticus]|uniref:ECF RNA polymerase sigma factor SigK n=1 Tax=Streptomyces antarcticus TaxID=2996458 RepID=UPI00227205A5|nr:MULTISPECIES: ECF RNA polymerase sigma factor SigK [unclassified Streptomyces]MCY0944897.1 ECF RNA polymerase sigma factor SigK [Streptomyces sp. H34-AA3]MCY0949439.1 ECF RNA polymerase sigma factor SigK [Streptomyces sp. H27-S2]MCZ4083340.1 ECF RNA polymerase sigma factor SigK [Streptomyces sp. H34-S5]
MADTAGEGAEPPGEPEDSRSGEAGDLDAQLLLAADGDREAFARVYDALTVPVMGLVCRVLRDADQAAEVTQDVMIEVWRTAGRFRPELGSAKAWVLVLAHRRAVDRVRAVRARGEREGKAALLDRTTPFDEVAAEVEEREEYAQVRRCLSALSEVQREAVLLAFYQGMTYREVARSLSSPEGTVKSRLRDGLQRLRACLEAS